ncbi:MAG: hypothetical protein HY269_03190, partial [Deltaproteobacteria bacterium]|nr:hypothetical protein [Deltaproteobacteria bacterium]
MEFDRETRLRFAEVTEAVQRDIANFWPVVKPTLKSILEDFYSAMTAEPALAKLIGGR